MRDNYAKSFAKSSRRDMEGDFRYKWPLFCPEKVKNDTKICMHAPDTLENCIFVIYSSASIPE